MFASMSGRLGSTVLIGVIAAGLLSRVMPGLLAFMAGVVVAALVWFAQPLVFTGDQPSSSIQPRFPPSLRAREREPAGEDERPDDNLH
jgi:hypothetical protein